MKDWNISINYGITTGYNEAFIISGEKRQEILENCQSDSERERTAELLRPILRGKDIKRYSYEFADKYLITTYNEYKNAKGEKIPSIDINDSPTIKAHLDGYWDKISTRQDQGDTSYNLRRCAYMDDFSKQKIIYPETVQRANFSLDDEGMLVDKTCFIIVGDNLEYLQKTLLSQLFEFAYKRLFSSIELGAAGFQYNKHALVKLPVKPFDNQEVTSDCDIFSIYNLSEEEINFISSSVNPNVRSKLPSNL